METIHKTLNIDSLTINLTVGTVLDMSIVRRIASDITTISDTAKRYLYFDGFVICLVLLIIYRQVAQRIFH